DTAPHKRAWRTTLSAAGGRLGGDADEFGADSHRAALATNKKFAEESDKDGGPVWGPPPLRTTQSASDTCGHRLLSDQKGSKKVCQVTLQKRRTTLAVTADDCGGDDSACRDSGRRRNGRVRHG
ncbi:unnamed protein product, partial [Symbiodinium sp. KB8]